MTKPHSVRLSRTCKFVVGVLIAVGAIVRVWILRSQFGAADSDESVVGLMARGFLHGDFVTYFWGQEYGGSLEAMVAAGLMAIFGVEVFALKITPVLLNIAASIVLWRIARRSFSLRTAAIGAAMFWASPFAFVWLSTKERGFYESGLLAGLVLVLCVLKMIDHPRWYVACIGGCAVGVALWSTPQSMYLILPGAIVFLFYGPSALSQHSRRSQHSHSSPDATLQQQTRLHWLQKRLFNTLSLWRAWPAVPGFLVGAFPALRINILNDWKSLDLPTQGTHVSTYWQRLEGFFREGVPLVVGAKIPYMREWVLPVIGPALIGVFAAAVIVAIARIILGRRQLVPGQLLLVLIVLLYPFIFAISPFSWYVGDGRYLSFLWPALALLAAWVLGKWNSIFALALSGLCVFTFVMLLHWPGQSYSHDLLTEDLDPLVKKLEADGVRYAYADYWIAYRVTLETDYRLNVSPAWSHRNIQFKEKVEASSDPTVYIEFNDSKEDKELRQRHADWQMHPRREVVGAFAIYTFDRDLPSEVVYDLAGY